MDQTDVDEQRAARILIVEDEPVIALNIEDILVDAGFQIAGVAVKLDQALALIEADAVDAAIVDANLAGVSASPAAVALAARGLPFIMMSGYSKEQMQGEFPQAFFLSKPCRSDLLIATLNSALRDKQGERARDREVAKRVGSS